MDVVKAIGKTKAINDKPIKDVAIEDVIIEEK
jgi:chorismate mutase